MRDLDRNLVYDLYSLSDDQLEIMLRWLKDNDVHWDEATIEDMKSDLDITKLKYNKHSGWNWSSYETNSVNALTLFENSKVYVIKTKATGLSDEEFRLIAESQGGIYSLKDFEDYLNGNPKIDFSYTKVRFII